MDARRDRNGTRIAVIDDTRSARLFSQWTLSTAGYRVDAFEDAAQGLDALARSHPDVVLVDLQLQDLNGMDVISCLHRTDPSAAIIAISAFPTPEEAVQATELGADDYLPKPFTSDELKSAVRRALARHCSSRK
jgi:DNA-binding response OmpR family regulator